MAWLVKSPYLFCKCIVHVIYYERFIHEGFRQICFAMNQIFLTFEVLGLSWNIIDSNPFFSDRNPREIHERTLPFPVKRLFMVFHTVQSGLYGACGRVMCLTLAESLFSHETHEGDHKTSIRTSISPAGLLLFPHTLQISGVPRKARHDRELDTCFSILPSWTGRLAWHPV